MMDTEVIMELTNWVLSKMFQSLLVNVMAIAVFIIFDPDYMFSIWNEPAQALGFLPTMILPAFVMYYFEIATTCFAILIVEIVAFMFWQKYIKN